MGHVMIAGTDGWRSAGEPRGLGRNDGLAEHDGREPSHLAARSQRTVTDDVRRSPIRPPARLSGVATLDADRSNRFSTS